MLIHLSITTGPQAGATFSSQEALSIGTDLANDVVLLDRTMAARHGRIETVDRSDTEVVVVADQNGIELPGLGALPQAHSAVVDLPFAMRLGDTTIEVTSTGLAPTGRPARWSATRSATCVLIALASALFLPSAVALQSAQPRVPFAETYAEAMAAQASPFDRPIVDVNKPPTQARVAKAVGERLGPATAVSARPDPALRASGPPALDRAKGALHARLAAEHLRGIELAVRDDILIATGSLFPKQMETWRKAQGWFDRTHAAGPVLVSRVVEVPTPDGKARAPKIGSVWFADPPYITVANVRYAVGSVLPNGWTLMRISTRDAVFVDRAGSAVSVSYGAE